MKETEKKLAGVGTKMNLKQTISACDHLQGG